jgi:hypothetical protein
MKARSRRATSKRKADRSWRGSPGLRWRKAGRHVAILSGLIRPLADTYRGAVSLLLPAPWNRAGHTIRPSRNSQFAQLEQLIAATLAEETRMPAFWRHPDDVQSGYRDRYKKGADDGGILELSALLVPSRVADESGVFEA